MNLISKTRTSWIVAGAAAAIFAGNVQAANDAAAVTVHYTKEVSTAQLYSKLKRASVQVCRQYEGKELGKIAVARACSSAALDQAVANVGDSALQTLHEANSDMRIAQRDTSRTRI